MIEEAERAFERGDWREARRIAQRELAAATDEARKAEAREMLDRFRNDPAIAILLAGAALLLACAVYFTTR